MAQDIVKEELQRLFVAVELPDAVRSALVEQQQGVPGMRWTPSGNMHLTLRFIGEVPLAQAEAIKAALRSVKTASFPLKVRGLGFFDRKPQAVLWAGVEPSAWLGELQKQVDRALECHAGLKVATGRFSPHITLGRMKQADKKALRAFTDGEKMTFSAEFPVQSFTLFSSVLAPGGAVHMVEERYPLLRIRPATPDDITEIFDVRCSVRENHMSREELAAIDITPDTVRGMITGGDYIVPVALVAGKIAGFAMARISEGYVFALFVRQEQEDEGFGRALMQIVESGLAEHGVQEAWLATGSETGIRAPGFYRHLGWNDCGLMEDGQLKFCKALQKVHNERK